MAPGIMPAIIPGIIPGMPAAIGTNPSGGVELKLDFFSLRRGRSGLLDALRERLRRLRRSLDRLRSERRFSSRSRDRGRSPV
jgi:hypothetical protein